MQTIEEYFINATPSQLSEYNRIRSLVTETVPEVTESMNYGIPTFKYKGKNLIHFGYFKNHVSLFPGPGPIQELKDKLTSYKLSKGTIQYDEKQPIPDDVVRQLILIGMETINSKA